MCCCGLDVRCRLNKNITSGCPTSTCLPKYSLQPTIESRWLATPGDVAAKRVAREIMQGAGAAADSKQRRADTGQVVWCSGLECPKATDGV